MRRGPNPDARLRDLERTARLHGDRASAEAYTAAALRSGELGQVRAFDAALEALVRPFVSPLYLVPSLAGIAADLGRSMRFVSGQWGSDTAPGGGGRVGEWGLTHSRYSYARGRGNVVTLVVPGVVLVAEHSDDGYGASFERVRRWLSLPADSEPAVGVQVVSLGPDGPGDFAHQTWAVRALWPVVAAWGSGYALTVAELVREVENRGPYRAGEAALEATRVDPWVNLPAFRAAWAYRGRDRGAR